MERVAFLLEQSGERIGCLLNPESLIRRRLAGVHPRRSLGGGLTGAGLSDDVLLYTGGGTTELRLDLLFDVTLAGSTITTEDVRDLTAPFWELTENQIGPDGQGRPPFVRFVWGKSWNIPGVITAISERLEYFTQGGLPRRSWVRMRFLRVRPSPSRRSLESSPPPSGLLRPVDDIPESEVQVYQVVGLGDRPDAISYQFYNTPFFWRLICLYNNIDDPLHLQPGQPLRIPPIR